MEKPITLFIKAVNNIFSYRLSQYDKALAYKTNFKIDGNVNALYLFHCQYFGAGFECQVMKNLMQEPIQRRKYLYKRLKVNKEKIEVNFRIQEIPHNT